MFSFYEFGHASASQYPHPPPLRSLTRSCRGLTAYCTLSLLLSMSETSNPSKNGVVARHHLTLLEQYDRRLQMGKDALEDMEAAKLELAASKSPNRVE